MDILVEVQLIEATAQRASRKDRGVLATRAEEIKRLAIRDMPGAVKMAVSPELQALMIQTADRRRATTYSRELAVVVDRERARFSAWYEMFPRSCSTQPGRPGTLERLRQPPGLCRRHGLRRCLPASDSSHRAHQPQRKKQRRKSHAGRCWKSVGDWLKRRRT